MNNKDVYISSLVGVGFMVVCLALVKGHNTVDIVSTYMAGWFFGQSEFVEIYGFAASDQFAALPPPIWSESSHARGFSGSYLTPYLYAPLWAALLAPVAAKFTIPEFVSAVYLLQIPMIFASVFMSWRLAGRKGWFAVWAVISLSILLTSAGGLLALSENQPQITVFFLVLLGYGFFQSRYYGWAGIVFALAASLKIFPLVFGLLFLAKRQWFGAIAMLATGCALLGVSIFLAGPALHLAFIEQIQNIESHVFVSRHNWSISAMLYQLQSEVGGGGGPAMYVISETPKWIQGVTMALFFGGLVGFVTLFSQSNSEIQQFRLFLALILLIGLVSPLGWSHSFLPLIFAAPVLLCSGPPRRGIRLLLLVFGVQSLALQSTLSALLTGLNWAQIMGTLSVIYALFLLLLDARKTNEK